MRQKTIVLGVCASIAAYRACEIINCLRKDHINVVVCMSKDAKHFITPLTLQTLSHNMVFSDMFEPAKEWDPVHISLAKDADLVVVAPATADIISRTATGICDDLLSCVLVSATSPVLFAPAMNEAMYKNKIIQSNIKRLKSAGCHFVGPIKGHLACNRQGIGHIADTADIVKCIKALLKKT